MNERWRSWNSCGVGADKDDTWRACDLLTELLGNKQQTLQLWDPMKQIGGGE